MNAYTACLHDRPLADALDVLAANGLTSVEVNTGGFLPAARCPVDVLLASDSARRDFLRALAEADPDMAVNIEHEDATFSREDATFSRTEGLAMAAKTLHAAAAAVGGES